MAGVDLNDVAVFVRVVEKGGFAKAARELALPTSTVSRTIARLEEAVGTRLLHRTTRSVRPTSEGRAFYGSVSSAVAALRAATRLVESDEGTPKGTLRLTAPNDIGSTLVADIVVAFQARHPLVQVEIELTNRTVNLVEEGFDVAIRAGRLQSSSLVARKIGSLEAHLYASPSYAERHGLPQTPADLAAHSCVVFRPRGGKGVWELEGDRGAARVEVTAKIGCDDYGFVRAAVLAGGGIGLIPAVLATADLRARRLLRVLPKYELRGASLFLVYPSARQIPAKVAAFRDFMVERCARGRVVP